jgi:hypothetical protein
MIGRAGIVVAATEAAAARRGAAMKTAAPTAVVATATTTVKAASATASMRAATATTAVTAATVLSERGTRRGNERNPKKRRKEEFKKCRPCHVYALHQQPVEPTKAPRKSCCAPSYQIGLTWSAVGCNPVNCYPINSPTEPRECPRSI